MDRKFARCPYGNSHEQGACHPCVKEAIAGRAYLLQGAELSKFLIWWRDDPDRKYCTLEQAAGAYLQTFPGRTIKLLIELLCVTANVSDPREQNEPGPPRPKD